MTQPAHAHGGHARNRIGDFAGAGLRMRKPRRNRASQCYRETVWRKPFLFETAEHVDGGAATKNTAAPHTDPEVAMVSKNRNFVNAGKRPLSERARTLRNAPAEIARSAAIKSAGQIKSLKDPVRALSQSGVRLTAISQSTAQSLIELQAEIVDAALSNAASQLERAAQTESVMALARDQADVLRAARERIVADLNQAVAIFKEASSGVRDVATHAYGNFKEPTARKTPARKKAVRKTKRPVRKTTARARKKKT
jgi:hypothetical protein